VSATNHINETEELDRLRARVAELEGELASAQTRYDLTVAATGHIVYDYNVATGAISWAGASEAILGMTPDELGADVDMWAKLIHPDDREEATRRLAEAEQSCSAYAIEYRFRATTGEYVWLFDRGLFAAGPDGAAARMLGTMQDITSTRRMLDERETLRDEALRAQQAALRELSTPLIPITEGLVVMPLVGAIDTARAQQIMETLLEGIAAQQAETAILDITGVRVVDTQVADALLRAAQAAMLLGARVILTGISGEVAQALVHLGADMRGIQTLSNLQSGIAYATEHR
jgi:rsbT co-antagonist protein RsbR